MMSDNLINFIKPKKIEPTLEAISSFINDNSREIERAFNMILEHQYYLYAISQETLRLICERIDENYGLRLDFLALQKEAIENVENHWNEIKAHILETINFIKLVEDIFKDKEHPRNSP